MHSSKAPGPDDMSLFYFQIYWDLVGGEVKEVQDMSQLRPIALCNVIYKIASKVLANRLKTFLPNIISPQQSVFYAGAKKNCGMIKDLLSLYEKASGQHVNLQKSNVVFSGNVPQATSQELAYILGVESVEKHKKYLGIPTLVDRSKSGTFAYLKDNLSKKLTGWRSKLLIVAERELLIKATSQELADILGVELVEKHKKYLGIPTLVGSSKSGLSALISDAVTEGQWQDLLRLYKRASRQHVNLQKSNVIFSGNVPQATSQELVDILGVELVEKHKKYLGIPTLVGRSKSGTFAYPNDNLSKKLTCWRSKLRSVAEMELLIKLLKDSGRVCLFVMELLQ
ncbi:hypothetical protein ACLB2K_050446 [Fragaria x ananassa]